MTLLVYIFSFFFFFNYFSLFYSESFVLFIAFFLIVIYLSKKFNNVEISNEEIRWNELYRFYICIKTFHRLLIRDTNARMYYFADFALQIKKFQYQWIKKHYHYAVRRDTILVHKTMDRRLAGLCKLKDKYTNRNTVIQYIPITCIDVQ